MQYHRMPIEIEAPEAIGYENIECNLSESSFADQRLSDLDISIDNLLLYYGDHKGKCELRELIVAETCLTTDDVLITPGAAAALFIIATSLLDKGDHLVVAKPNYATNIETPRTIGAEISFLNLHFEDKYQLHIEELERLITPKTKLISLTYPHNPTGTSIDEITLKKVIEIIERKGCYLLMDETYREMNFTGKLPIAATLSDKVISVSSMSKAYGLPGIRTGWVLCRNKYLLETFLAAKEQIVITNSVADEEIAFQYLKRKDELFAKPKATILNNFSIVKNFMQNQQLLEWIEPQGGCVCFPRIKKDISLDVDDFYHILLNKYKTYVGSGHWFEEDKRYMRIGFGWTSATILEKGLNNILKAINETKPYSS
jgi:aspartate/methionine/tyrosine aminotransferase